MKWTRDKPRNFTEAKCSGTPYQNGKAASRHYYPISVFPIEKQSGDSEYLRRLLKVNCVKHGKPFKPHL